MFRTQNLDLENNWHQLGALNDSQPQLLQLRKPEEGEHQLINPIIPSLYNQRTQARKKNKRNPPTPE